MGPLPDSESACRTLIAVTGATPSRPKGSAGTSRRDCRLQARLA